MSSDKFFLPSGRRATMRSIMSEKINPTDTSLEPISLEPEGLGSKFGTAALSIAGFAFWPAGLAAIIKNQFADAERLNRIVFVAQAIDTNFKRLQSQISADREKLKELQARLDAPRFQEAVGTACEEAARTTSTKKIERMIAVLTGSLEPSQWADPDADLAATIRDIAQLGEQDIYALRLLKTAFRDVIRHLPNLNDPNAFTERVEDYRTTITLAKIDPEDFYAACARLNGFGLALEVVRNVSRMHPHEHLFRPTRRGLALLDCLERFGSADEGAPQ